MYLALILLPILGSIASGFFGRKIGISGSQLITCSSVLITTFLAVVAFIEVVILLSSVCFDDILGQTFSIYIIAIAGAESAIGLGILVAFYRLRGNIAIEYK